MIKFTGQLLLCLFISPAVTDIIRKRSPVFGDYGDARRFCFREKSSLLKWEDLSNMYIIKEIRNLTTEANYTYFWIDNCKKDNGTWISQTKSNCIFGSVKFNYNPVRKFCGPYSCGAHLHTLCKTKVIVLYPDTTQPPGSSTSNDKNSKPEQENKTKKRNAHAKEAVIGLFIIIGILLSCVVALICQKCQAKKGGENNRKENNDRKSKAGKTYDDKSKRTRSSFNQHRVLGIGINQNKRSDFETVTISFDKTDTIHIYDEPDDIEAFEQQIPSTKNLQQRDATVYQNTEITHDDTSSLQEKGKTDLGANDISKDIDEEEGCRKDLPQYTNTTLRNADNFEVLKAGTENSQHLYLGLESRNDAVHEIETQRTEYTNTLLKD